MSRIGRLPIEIPAGVTVTVNDGLVTVKGPKGELTQEFRSEVDVKVEDNIVNVTLVSEEKGASSFWGLTRALIANMIEGVTEGFEKKLQMIGMGYRAKKISDKKISMTVGFSHPVEFDAPEGVTLDVEGTDLITISGFDKQQVGLTAALIRKIKKPEPYKGKGIRYIDEVVKRKAGKAGKI